MMTSVADTTAGAPLIVTAVLDPISTAHFDEQRRRYFPAERLVVGAHVTLFPRLPDDREGAVATALTDEAALHRPMEATVVGPRSLGRGVAYDLDCPALVAVRTTLAARWHDLLTPQDRAWRHAHVTVRNKVTADVARATLAELRTERLTAPARVEGLALWRYLGGPWEGVAIYDYTRPARNAGRTSELTNAAQALRTPFARSARGAW